MQELEDASDAELLSRWRAGDRAAGAALVERHHHSVARFFASKVGPAGEDLVQATFLGLLEGALDRFRADASFRTFLFAIARNKLLVFLRDAARDRERFDPEASSIAAIERSAPGLIAAHQQSKLLLAGLRRLPVDTQLMLELHYWEDMRVREIAEVLELPVNTVKTRMRRGRLRLDEEMRALASSQAQLETTLRGLEGWARELERELDQS
jgi:RNA polymerase sigma-70 factor (ECF subfamily)